MLYSPNKYRETEGIKDQQNAIDKAKGIIAKPMPREWYDRHVVNKMEDEKQKRFYRDIVADKKPYFMRYIYPKLMKEYNSYLRSANRNAIREFGVKIEDMLNAPAGQLTDRQIDFLRYYRVRLPVGVGDCVMNKICRRFEDEFDGFAGKIAQEGEFDYSIMKSGASYNSSQKTAVKRLYEDYNRHLQNYVVFSNQERIDKDESTTALTELKDEFLRECLEVCSNSEALCDIILDVCYGKSASKRFVWDMCGETIVSNLLANNDRMISAPVADDDGDIEYCGRKYKTIRKKMGEMV